LYGNRFGKAFESASGEVGGEDTALPGFGLQPLTIGDVHLAQATSVDAIVTDTDHCQVFLKSESANRLHCSMYIDIIAFL
jgi:hypothetical protein